MIGSKPRSLGLACALTWLVYGCVDVRDRDEDNVAAADASNERPDTDDEDAGRVSPTGDDATDPDTDADLGASDPGLLDAGARGAEESGSVGNVDAAQPRAHVDVSTDRMTQVAHDFCQTAFMCDAAMGRQVFGSETLCRKDVPGFWQDDLATNGAECVDAQVDLYDCYAAASCADQYTACAAEEGDVMTLCPDDDTF